MLVSFHPLLIGDVYRTCAGRQPDADDLHAIRRASAVLLPQGCYQTLYEMARQNCTHVFPNYDARFRYPGKTGQRRMFAQAAAPIPETAAYPNIADFRSRHPAHSAPKVPGGFPCLFKFAWGDEGQTVFGLQNQADLQKLLDRAAAFEATGQQGFLLQAQLPDPTRALRVVKIYNHLSAYWRVQSSPTTITANLAQGAQIDPQVDDGTIERSRELVEQLCCKTGIDMAGFDLMPTHPDFPIQGELSFLEVNYFFGRTGLGGSTAFYKLLYHQVNRWLADREMGPLNPDSRQVMGIEDS